MPSLPRTYVVDDHFRVLELTILDLVEGPRRNGWSKGGGDAGLGLAANAVRGLVQAQVDFLTTDPSVDFVVTTNSDFYLPTSR